MLKDYPKKSISKNNFGKKNLQNNCRKILKKIVKKFWKQN